MMLTIQSLCKALPGLPPEHGALFLEPLQATMEEFSIDTPERAAMFLAHCAHESAHFTRLEENLNYSAERLLAVFPRYFTPDEAQVYAHRLSAIASRVYANRMGNGDEASADGWHFRGRGIIQITGRRNYLNCGVAIGVDLVENHDLLLEPELACRSAGWFWHVNGLNQCADTGDIAMATLRINGGTNGLQERRRLWSVAKIALRDAAA